MAGLTLTLLGGFGARRAGEVPVVIGRRKAEALLAYLARTPGRAYPREKLASLLWPELSDRGARHSLRQALVVLRQALPPGVLRMDEATLAVEPEAVDVDVVDFERLVSEATPEALQRAVALYQGEFLAGVPVAEAPFEDWLQAERERLREMALEGFARLLAQQCDAGDAPAALQTARRLLALDPLQEVVHRTLMRLQAAQGRRDAALRQYQACVDVLQRELGLEPESETKALYREILRRRDDPSPVVAEDRRDAPARLTIAPPPTSRFETPDTTTAIVGRDAELARLGGALDAPRPARALLIVVLGEAGIGKSRLLSEFGVRAAARGARVLLGRCYQSAMIMPFAPWVDALRSGGVLTEATRGLDPVWRGELARLFPELTEPGRAPADRSDDGGRLFESIARLLEHLAASQPLVVMLEDVHWADGMSVRLLASLARRTPTAPVVLVASARDDELTDTPILRDVLHELAAEGRLDRVALTALSKTETVELVRGLVRTGSDTATLATRVWELSHGNPFMVVETMAALEQGSPLGPTGGLALPEGVRDVIARRLDRLSATGRSLVAVAAVIGREFEFPLLRQASMLEEGEVAEGLEELVRRRVLRMSHERFDFTHDRIREVAASQLLPPRRALLHRQVAEALESLTGDAPDRDWAALGTHCREAGLWEQAAGYFREAGRKASARSARREAALCLEQATAALRRAPRTREMLERLVDLHFELRNTLYLLNDLPRLRECLAQVEDAARELDDPRRLAWLSLYAGQLRWWTEESGDAQVFAESAEKSAEQIDDVSLTITTAIHAGFAWYNAGHYRRAVRSQEQVLELLRHLPADRHRGYHSSPVPAAHVHLTRCLAELGEFPDGIRHGREALREGEALGDRYRTMVGSWCLGELYRIQGDLGQAIPLLERAIGLVRDRRLSPQFVSTLGHAYVLAGRLDEGLALLEESRAALDAVGWHLFKARVLEQLGQAHLFAGRLDEARAFAGQALDWARKRGERGFEAWALRLRGEIEARSAPAAVEPAAATYRLALRLAADLGMRPLAAHCHLGLGRHLRRSGAPESEEHLAIAAAMCGEMGMTPTC